MGQTLSGEPDEPRSREQLVQQLAGRFRDKCLTNLEFYSFQEVFKTLADQQGSIKYLKEDTVSRFLEIPDILGASPIVFQMVSHLGSFPFLQDAPAVLELPQMIMVVVIMTERHRRVLAKGSDRTKLLFKSLAVYDRKASQSPEQEKKEDAQPKSSTGGFAIDEAGDEYGEDIEEEDDDLVLTALELLDVNDAVKASDRAEFHGAMIPTDNFRKLLLLLLLTAPLDPQESLSQYSAHFTGENLDRLRMTAENILASFVDVEKAPGIKLSRFRHVIPTAMPNLFKGFNGLFDRFLFSKDLDLSKRRDDDEKTTLKIAQPLLQDQGEILHEHTLSQLSLFLPPKDLFRRVRLLYSGNEHGFSMGSFESKVFNWRAPTLLLVRGSRLSATPDGGQEAAFAEALPPKRFPDGGKGDNLTFGIYVQEPWRYTHKDCFGGSDSVLFQLEPVHDVFQASTINKDYVTFTKPPSNEPLLAFGSPHPKPSKANRRQVDIPLGPVSLVLGDSFEFGVFNHDYNSRGGAFHGSNIRRYDFQDRFRVGSLEVWGCGGDEEAKAQAERWAWEAREVEARRKINMGTGDQEADRQLLQMAGIIGSNRSGGSMA